MTAKHNAKIFTAATLLAFLAGSASAATVVVDNLDLPTPSTAGAQSSYVMQSFTPDVAGIGTSDTVTANSPLPATVYLQTATFLRAPDGSGGSTAGELFIDVYEGVGNGGTYLGSSSTTVDIDSAAASAELTWNFDNIALSSGTEYTLLFSNNNVAGGVANARLTAANNGGGFVNTYNGGVADDSSNGQSPVPFDTRFQVTLSTVPEPGSLALLGLGGLLIARRRRG